jgi:glutathione S-transferase
MKLYYSPGACSLSPHIVLLETGLPATLVKVDTKAHTFGAGADFYAINGKGYVPVLELDDGRRLTEGPAIVQYLADRKPESQLAPVAGSFERYRLQEWLNFITSELHKLVFSPLLDPRGIDGAKSYAHDKVGQRLAYLNTHLTGREFLLDRFTVADAYLVVVLNWTRFAGVDLAQWPAVQSYFERLRERPSVARAMDEELALYKAEQARRAA